MAHLHDEIVDTGTGITIDVAPPGALTLPTALGKTPLGALGVTLPALPGALVDITHPGILGMIHFEGRNLLQEY